MLRAIAAGRHATERLLGAVRKHGRPRQRRVRHVVRLEVAQRALKLHGRRRRRLHERQVGRAERKVGRVDVRVLPVGGRDAVVRVGARGLRLVLHVHEHAVVEERAARAVEAHARVVPEAVGGTHAVLERARAHRPLVPQPGAGQQQPVGRRLAVLVLAVAPEQLVGGRRRAGAELDVDRERRVGRRQRVHVDGRRDARKRAAKVGRAVFDREVLALVVALVPEVAVVHLLARCGEMHARAAQWTVERVVKIGAVAESRGVVHEPIADGVAARASSPLARAVRARRSRARAVALLPIVRPRVRVEGRGVPYRVARVHRGVLLAVGVGVFSLQGREALGIGRGLSTDRGVRREDGRPIGLRRAEHGAQGGVHVEPIVANARAAVVVDALDEVRLGRAPRIDAAGALVVLARRRARHWLRRVAPRVHAAPLGRRAHERLGEQLHVGEHAALAVVRPPQQPVRARRGHELKLQHVPVARVHGVALAGCGGAHRPEGRLAPVGEPRDHLPAFVAQAGLRVLRGVVVRVRADRRRRRADRAAVGRVLVRATAHVLVGEPAVVRAARDAV